MPNRYAVMGHPVAKSLSPVIHQGFAHQTGEILHYEKILIDLAHFEQQVTEFFSQGGKGLNITLPCKVRAFAMSAKATPRCEQARAANTLWMHSGQLHADNTDGVGFLRDISRYVTLVGRRILILGAGGAARGILGPLLDASPAQLTIANRTLEKAQALQKEFLSIDVCALDALENKPYDVIINATSKSLDDASVILPTALMLAKPFCYDLAYQNNGTTAFVAWARNVGCQAEDGLGMLVEQAAEAFYIWHKMRPDTAEVLKHLRSS